MKPRTTKKRRALRRLRDHLVKAVEDGEYSVWEAITGTLLLMHRGMTTREIDEWCKAYEYGPSRSHFDTNLPR